MKNIVIATKNKHKIKEFEEMLAPFGYKVLSLFDIDKTLDIEETGTTFEENALLKAQQVHDILGCEVISDDSGLCIDFYDGGPGVYSARWLGSDTSYDVKNQRILDDMSTCNQREARYVCCIAHIDKEGKGRVYRGECEGEIATHANGTNGFGYDPIFYYPAYKNTLASVSEEEKNAISHRGRALIKLIEGMGKQ